MNFKIKETKEKVKSSYKTLYLSEDIIEQVSNIAKEHNTSFNNIIVSMIEHCLEESKKPSD